jgi:fatty acid/phospholipid biosynthesis enzyme
LNGISQDIITIALDAMGGDNAPVNDVAGAVKTVRETEHINIVCGNKMLLKGAKAFVDAGEFQSTLF